MSKHDFYYTSSVSEQEQRYTLELPLEATPVRWWTLTNNMGLWTGEVTEVTTDSATAITIHRGKLVEVSGKIAGSLKKGGPCYIMEHLSIDGIMEYLICSEIIQSGNKNFVNFGTPNGKHLRIDIYTGESKVING